MSLSSHLCQRLHIGMFVFNDTAAPEIYTYCHTLSLHDVLPFSVDLGIADRPDPFFADSNFGPPIIGADGATRETARSQRSDQGEFDRRYHVVAPGRSDRRDAVVFARNILNAMIIGAPNTNNKTTRLKAVSKAITAHWPPTARPTMAVAVFAAALASPPRDTSTPVGAAIR